MFSKINHVAIVSEKYAVLSLFYQSLFGMKPSAKQRPSAPRRSATAMSG